MWLKLYENLKIFGSVSLTMLDIIIDDIGHFGRFDYRRQVCIAFAARTQHIFETGSRMHRFVSAIIIRWWN